MNTQPDRNGGRERRIFQDVDPATISRPEPLGIGIYGYTGRGKSWSAALLAEGIQRVYGGDVFYADTEGRSLALRGRFKFRYIDFPAPHNADDFADLLRQYSMRRGVLVIDQMTEEHEGEAGLLETFERVQGGKDSRNAVAWGVAKRGHEKLTRVLRATMRTLPVIITWRAKDKLDWSAKNREGKTEPRDLGEMPIGSMDLPFEMSATYLLPKAGERRGVPVLDPKEPGEIMMTKIPEWLQGVVKPGEAFSSAHGEAFARWAMAGCDTDFERLSKAMRLAQGDVEIQALGGEAKELLRARRMTRGQVEELAEMAQARRASLAAEAGEGWQVREHGEEG